MEAVTFWCNSHVTCESIMDVGHILFSSGCSDAALHIEIIMADNIWAWDTQWTMQLSNKNIQFNLNESVSASRNLITSLQALSVSLSGPTDVTGWLGLGSVNKRIVWRHTSPNTPTTHQLTQTDSEGLAGQPIQTLPSGSVRQRESERQERGGGLQKERAT